MSYSSSMLSCTVRGKKEQESEENVRNRIVHTACFCLYEKKVREGAICMYTATQEAGNTGCEEGIGGMERSKGKYSIANPLVT